jgi:ABC-type phosphate/phosphonate transport system substrate-binding protein
MVPVSFSSSRSTQSNGVEGSTVTSLVIGYLGSQSATSIVSEIAALKDGLKETGFTVGKNVQMEFLRADDQYDMVESAVVPATRCRNCRRGSFIRSPRRRSRVTPAARR